MGDGARTKASIHDVLALDAQVRIAATTGPGRQAYRPALQSEAPIADRPPQQPVASCARLQTNEIDRNPLRCGRRLVNGTADGTPFRVAAER